MPLSELTNRIVESRRSRVSTFAEYRNKLNSISDVLGFVTRYQDNTLWNEIIIESKNEEKWKQIQDRVINLKHILDAFVSRDGEFSIAESRASREFVNIGSIGIMREGKSEFVAQTTNLDKWVLPRKKGEHACTTASINVINGSSPDGKNNIVRVYFYSVKEIVSLFGDYLDEFNIGRNLIDSSINTREGLRNWCSNNASVMEQRIPSSQSKLKKKFMEYLQNVNVYVDRLTEGDEISDNNQFSQFADFNIEDIKNGGAVGQDYYSSVSYYKTPDSMPGSEVFTSFATRKAEIYTNFNVDGEYVDNIQFLDTPGIGEKKVGVDRILSDAVAMNLDIIIAIRALNGNAKEEQEQAFVNILRGRLNGKDSAREWVYYLLNIYDGQDYSVAENCIKDLNYHLSTGDDTSAIILQQDHFRVINLHEGYQLNPDDSQDSNNPIGRYLHQIFTDLIPKIDIIDNEFFSNATIQYNNIVSEYDNLCSLINQMALPDYDDYDRIKRLIEDLHIALAKENARNPRIFSSIKHNIDEFCALPSGMLVAKVFDAKDLSFKDSDDFYKKNKSAVQTKYDEGGYNSNYDFQTYSNLKRDLAKIIKLDIEGRIDQSDADKLLLETKQSVAKVFINEGKMDFISSNPQEWLSKAIKMMENEGRYPNLLKLIATFANYKIQIMPKLDEHIDSVILRSIHHDDFGDPEEYDFQEYDNAACAITHSLFQIESYAKGLISDQLVSSDIDPMQISFSQLFYETTKLATNTEPHKANQLRDELYHFCKNHSAEIFKGEKSLQKMGLVSSWRDTINSK